MELNEILKLAVHTLDSHKGEELLALQVAGLTSNADCFLLVSGGSANQVRSLADYLEEALGKQGVAPQRISGYAMGDWITMDYGDLIVHIFKREQRAFYDLERLWSDAPALDIAPYMVQKDEDQ